MLPRRVRPYGEHRVTAGPLTGLREIIFGNFGNTCWALALALFRGRWYVDRWRRRLRHHAPRQPLPIAAALLPSASLPRCAVPPAPTRLPAPPPPRCLAAGRATVTILRMRRPIATLAAFEQAAPTTKMLRPGNSRLLLVATSGILKGTQGRSYSRRSCLGGELLLPPRRFHLDTTTLQGNERSRDMPSEHALAGRSTRRGIGPKKSQVNQEQQLLPREMIGRL